MKTFANLKAEIASWMRRSDLTSIIPTFVALAEMEIFNTHENPLRVREMEVETTLTVTSLTASLPTDFLDARYIKQDNAVESLLMYMPPNKWNLYKCGYFTIVENEIRLPTGASTNLNLVYYAKPAALTDDADTSAVLDTYYGIYLSASLKYASTYVKDDSRAQMFQGQMNEYLFSASGKNKSNFSGPLTVVTA